jgi:hypothetical protein
MQQLASAVGGMVVTAFEGVAQVMTALQPAFEQLSGIVKDLQPVFKQMVSAAVSVLTPLIQAVTDLLPVIRLFGAVQEGVAKVIEAVAAVFSGIYNSLFGGANLGEALKGTIENIRAVFEGFAKSLVLASAAIASFVGATTFRTNLMKYLEKRPEPPKKAIGGLGAATNASFKTFAQLGQDIALASLTAQGQLGDKVKSDDPTVRWQDEVLTILKNNKESDVLRGYVDQLKKTIEDGVREITKHLPSNPLAISDGTADRVGRFIVDNGLGGLLGL